MPQFSLILEERCPVAALVPKEISDRQLDIIYCLLPERAFSQVELAKRWNIHRVLAVNDWAQAQLKRRPMLPPKTTKLSFP